MRGPSYRKRLALAYVVLAVTVGAAVLLVVEHALERDLLREVDARLESQARGAAAWVSEGRHPDKLAVRLGNIVGAHVTILDGAGLVLGDSEPSVVLGKNDAALPEIAGARTSGLGRTTRATGSGPPLRYVAVSADPTTLLRVGTSLGPVFTTMERLRTRLAVAFVVGLGVAVGLALTASRIASRLANDKLRIDRLEVTRRDFVANVSHELRTPTTAIKGYSETLLAGGVDAETTQRFLETMHRQATRIGALVTDLLRLSEVEARAPGSTPRTEVRLSDTARQAVATVREGHAARGREIELDVPDGLVVRGDPVGVEQIVENLVENAVRYGEGRVSVTAAGQEDRVRLVVADAGPGISAEHLPRIFERFYRADATRSQVHGGTGLGLAIVKHLAESMGGTVRVESELGKGSRFIVELPRD